MAMTSNERKENNLNKLLLSVSAQIDREESDYPQKEIDQARKTLIKNASNMYSAVEIENYLQNERDTRAEAKREQALNANPLLEKRQIRAEGGSLLLDDREQYNGGGEPSWKSWIPGAFVFGDTEVKGQLEKEALRARNKIVKKAVSNEITPKEFKKELQDLGKKVQSSAPTISNSITSFITKYPDTKEFIQEYKQAQKEKALESNPLLEKRQIRAEGGDIDAQMETLMPTEETTHTMPDGTEMAGATHGEYEEQMEGLMDKETPMLPDEEMEEDYVDYVMDETLSDEDKNYLISTLEQDDRLSMIFDQVVESATEFSGEGPVDGPGTEKSDSIPARLSDGEFVFTAKATEEIGVDNLMSMMKDAEAGAEQRQGVAYGGMVEDEGDPKATPIQTTGLLAAQGNIPNVAKPNRQVEEEMLKASPRRYYVPLSG